MLVNLLIQNRYVLSQIQGIILISVSVVDEELVFPYNLQNKVC